MSCCSDKKARKTPDCMAAKSITVTTPEGEEVQATVNLGTGEITYGDESTCCCQKQEKETQDS